MKSLKSQRAQKNVVLKFGFNDIDGDEHEVEIIFHPLSSMYEAVCEDFPKVVKSSNNLNTLIAEYIDSAFGSMKVMKENEEWEVQHAVT